MRFLVTGGAGFIGSHLCDLIVAEGHEVHVLDDLSTGSRRNLEQLEKRSNFALTVGSVCDRELVGDLVSHSDAVLHLAAAVGVQLVVSSPVRAMETNVRGSQCVLDEAARHGVPVLLASTSEVYGKSAALPFREDGDLQLGPTDKSRWAYACSKAIDEFLAMAYWREQRLPVIVARLFNVSGPRQSGSYGMVIPRFVAQALAGHPLTVFGDGAQQRCFCHVADVVQALWALMCCEGAFGRVFNVGAKAETTIYELARRTIAVTESSSTVAYIPYEEAYGEGFEDMLRRIPDTSRIRDLLGWEPTRSLEQIIGDMASHQLRADSLRGERSPLAPQRGKRRRRAPGELSEPTNVVTGG